MININNKQWNDLCFTDILEFLESIEIENNFFEFKADDVKPEKMAEEISAFANTYGGYIFLGIGNGKCIEGCVKWTEERIHNVIHDSLSPVPQFDVKQFIGENKTIYVIKIEEGKMPPYITNKGKIFGRVSSGSYVINNSSQLEHLYRKYENGIRNLKDKIEIPPIEYGGKEPTNFCGYIDVGFSVSFSEEMKWRKKFFNVDIRLIVQYLRSIAIDYSISQVGFSYLVSLGGITTKDNTGKEYLMNAGANTFIEIMADGSAKYRIMLDAEEGTFKVNITPLITGTSIFLKIYEMIFDGEYENDFISAYKYERLSLLKQFAPYYELGPNDTENDKIKAREFENAQELKYGKNIVISSNRIPVQGYTIVDKSWIEGIGKEYNNASIIKELFYSDYENLGFFETLNLNDGDIKTKDD